MSGTGGRVVLAIVAIALLGAALFGVWHLVVGGFINGNPHAGSFGFVLGVAAGVPLVVGTWLVRRHRRHALVA